MNRNWNCPKKKQARLDTIVTQFRTHFGPCVVNQYWSMAGLCDKPGCELDQLVSTGLVTERQFHGVEIIKDIYQRNVTAYPNAHWYNDDFFRAMSKAKNDGIYFPDIVNADLIQTCVTGASLINNIFGLMNSGMLVANFIMSHRQYDLSYTAEDVLDALNEGPRFRWAMRNGWQFEDRYYEYAGTGKQSATTMGTFVFFKPHAQVQRMAA